MQLGSRTDLEFVAKYPLSRARHCLNECLDLCRNNNCQDISCLESARVALSYVWLELNNPTYTLQLTELVLGAPDVAPHNSKEYFLSRRRRATARIYAHEAMSMLQPGASKEGVSVNDNANLGIDTLTEDLTMWARYDPSGGSAHNSHDTMKPWEIKRTAALEALVSSLCSSVQANELDAGSPQDTAKYFG